MISYSLGIDCHFLEETGGLIIISYFLDIRYAVDRQMSVPGWEVDPPQWPKACKHTLKPWNTEGPDALAQVPRILCGPQADRPQAGTVRGVNLGKAQKTPNKYPACVWHVSGETGVSSQ